MSDNLKKFLEKVGADEVLAEKAKTIKDEAAVIEFAKSLGFELSEEDFKNAPEEMSLDELDAASGGKACACVTFGLGEEGDWDSQCTCGVYGQGKGNTKKRCYCFLGGGGKSEHY